MLPLMLLSQPIDASAVQGRSGVVDVAWTWVVCVCAWAIEAAASSSVASIAVTRFCRFVDCM